MEPTSNAVCHENLLNRGRAFIHILFSVLGLAGLSLYLLSSVQPAAAAGVLTVDIVAGYNLVVDSNVESPSTYAPSVATVMGSFCNTGDTSLTGVQGYIGNFAGGTPGLYPARDSSQAAFIAEHPHLANTGLYAYTHVGGSAGTADATRYMGTLAPGECKNQYWHVTYPRRGNPNNSGNPVWGETNVPEDDLHLDFDVWGTSAEGSNNSATWTMTMRNEISANANKIFPNDADWFNTNSSDIYPGDVITTNGVNYELGVINKGFDNDGDFAYDYNAWMQPVGDPSYDPSCFRLIRTSGVLTVSISAGDPEIIEFQDQLYFTNISPNNNGVRGRVYYTFLALDGPCSVMLTPYQEVASGADNEKFNGDYGYAPPTIQSYAPALPLDKSVDKATAVAGERLTYTMVFSNTGTDTAGLPEYGVPVVLQESIPAGTTYVAGSAAASNSYSFTANPTILYSTDNGTSWTATEPSPASDTTDIQWWLDVVMPVDGEATLTFQVDTDNPYTEPSPFINNTAGLSFGAAAPFVEDSAVTMIQGSNTIGDTVWQDDDGDGSVDGGESGLANVTVQLWWDQDGNGSLSSGDVLIDATETDGSGSYSFANLPNGNFLVQVDESDGDIPAGYFNSTEEVAAVTGLGTLLPSSYLDADFGFAPSIDLTKSLISATPAQEGDEVVYTIAVENLRGDGTGTATSCSRTFWTTNLVSSTGWTNMTNALGAAGPNDSYASAVFQGGSDIFRTGTMSIAGLSGNITQVEAIYSTYITGALVNDTVSMSAFGVPGGAGDDTDNPLDVSNIIGLANKRLVGFVINGSGWTPANIAALDIQITASKVASQDGQTLFVDAMGVRVTTDEPCGYSDVLNPAPLTDVYDADRLTFVSAEPAESTVTTGGGAPYANTGTITWNTVGPIYAGETKVITVTFTALEPPDSGADGEADAVTITNTATIANAYYLNGDPANDDTDDAVNTLEPAGSIGDFIWNDVDGDGVYEPLGADGQPNTADDERGIAGVIVELQDGSCTPGVNCVTTVTDSSGGYLFAALADGTYTVVVATTTLPGGGAGSANTSDLDSDNDSNSGAIIINSNDGNPANDDELDADFGYSLPAIIEGNIWHDWNRDGGDAPDSGEEGLANITVYLDDGLCTYPGSCATTTTDASGHFEFIGVTPGSYDVTVDTSTGALNTGSWTQSYDDPNGPDGVPGNGDDVVALDDIVPVTVVAGGLGQADYSYYQTGSSDIGDTLYADWNGDGSQDTGEEGLANITVWLYEDSNGDGIITSGTDALIMTDVTDASGQYLFSGLPAGNYIVLINEADGDFPAGYAQTGDPDEGATVCTTCDGQSTVTTDGTADVLTVDFGYQPTGGGVIGDYVWQDDDSDGIQDAGESALANVTVTLFEDTNGNGQYDAGADAVVATAVTDAGGNYLFTGLAADNYVVVVDTGDADLPTDGNGDPYVSSTGGTAAITLAANQINLTADFGFAAGATIGDTIYMDADGDGTQATTEAGLANITVELWLDTDNNGTPDVLEDTMVTSLDGTYSFTGLAAGDYVVVVDTGDADLPAGGSLSGDPDETGACTTCDGQHAVNVSAGQTYLAADFGFEPANVIGDFIWTDLDGDGVQDAGESGIPGVVITLTLQSSTVITTVTDADGHYYFGDVPDGTHTVAVKVSTLPAGLTQSGDPDEVGSCITCDNSATVAITGQNSDLSLDFGYELSGSLTISGNVFRDNDQDGVDRESGETGIQTVNLYLWRDTNSDGIGDNLVGTTTSASDGTYSFTGLPDGTYTVSIDPGSPTVNTATLTTAGLGHDNDGNAYEHVTLAGSSATDIDFGYYTSAPTALGLSDLGVAPGGHRSWLFLSSLLVALSVVGLALNRRRSQM